MQLDPVIFYSFLIGVATGAAGQYFADKYSDRRREKEAAKRTRETFRNVAAKMPALLQEMRNDLKLDNTEVVREFVVLHSKGVTFSGSNKRRFRYFETEHEALREKLDMLLHVGFIVDVSSNSTPLFRMEDAFVELLGKELENG